MLKLGKIGQGWARRIGGNNDVFDSLVSTLKPNILKKITFTRKCKRLSRANLPNVPTGGAGFLGT